MLNLDLTRAVAVHGLHFAPDPSSQQTCSIGGNVANNSGGPHCLAEGVTNAHIIALEVVLPDGTVTVLGGEDPEPLGFDLRGVFVGSEGMLGVTTKVCVKLTPDPPAICTMLMDFDSVEAGASTVSAVIAAGVVPAAMEMMDQLCLQAVEAYIQAGLPVDAAAALLVEVVGLPHGVAADTELITRIARDHGVRTVRVAADDVERALLWKGRKSAFGAIARIKPNYYLHDTVVPRAQLPAVLAKVYEITARHDLLVLNVFHAGDGNLHPLLVYDAREPGVMERVHAAGDEIVRVSVEAGGVLSRRARHRAREARPDAADVLARRPRRPGRAARRVRPARPGQPGQGAAEPGRLRRPPGGQGGGRGRVDLTSFADAVGTTDPVTVSGLGTRGGPVPGVRAVAAPVGIDWIQPAEMTVSVRRRHARRRARRRARAPTASGWRCRRAAPSAARWPSAAAGSAGSATARSATPCCRCATCRRPARSSRPADRRSRTSAGSTCAGCSSGPGARSGSSAT